MSGAGGREKEEEEVNRYYVVVREIVTGGQVLRSKAFESRDIAEKYAYEKYGSDPDYSIDYYWVIEREEAER